MQIEGGFTGNLVDVTQNNQLEVFAQSISAEWYNTVVHQSTFSVVFEAVTPTAVDHFIYLLNSTDRSLLITELTLYGTVNERIEVQHVTGTVSAGTVLTPVNRSLASGKTLSGSYQSGVSLGGLSATSTVDHVAVAANNLSVRNYTANPIVIPSNQAVALEASVGGNAISGSITLMRQLSRPLRFT